MFNIVYVRMNYIIYAWMYQHLCVCMQLCMDGLHEDMHEYLAYMYVCM